MQRKKFLPPPFQLNSSLYGGPFPLLKCIFLSFSHAILCCVNTKQGENIKPARTAPDTASFSPCSTFCVAELSTGAKITPHLFVISSLARASGESSDADALCLSHTSSRAASLKYRPFVWWRYDHRERVLLFPRKSHTVFTACGAVSIVSLQQRLSGKNETAWKSHRGKKSRRNDSALNLNSDENE